MSDTAGAQFLRARRETQIGVDLAFGEKFHRVEGAIRAGYHIEVGGGVETDLGGNQVKQPGVVGRRAPALQLTDPANVLLGEEVVTADLDAGKHDNGCAANDRPNGTDGVVAAEIRLASPDRLPDGNRRHLHVANIGKAFGTQQVFGDVLRRDADAINFPQADGCRFRRSILRKRVLPNEARCAGRRKGSEEAASVLCHPHDVAPFSIGRCM